MKALFKGIIFFTAACLNAPATQASEYGCRVLLCLANPASNGGPRGIAECRSTIDRLFDDLSHGRPFPSCDLSDGNDGNSYARQVFDYYDPCPSGTSPAPAGMWVAEKSNSAPQAGGRWGFGYSSKALPSFENGRGPRACVSQFDSSYYFRQSRFDDAIKVNVYRKVIWQNPQSPRAIDVYVNHAFYQRIRW